LIALLNTLIVPFWYTNAVFEMNSCNWNFFSVSWLKMEDRKNKKEQRSENPINPSVQWRCMASNSNTNEKTERCSSQMAKDHLGHFLEGQSNKWRGQSQKWTTHYGWHTQWKKTAGLDVWYEWITSAYPIDIRCTGRFRRSATTVNCALEEHLLTYLLTYLREVQVVRVQTGGAQSTRIC